jgi:uncharacterized protein YggE
VLIGLASSDIRLNTRQQPNREYIPRLQHVCFEYQKNMAPLEIKVTGSASAHQPAERATLILHLNTGNHPTSEDALTALTSTINNLVVKFSPYCSSSNEPENIGIPSYSLYSLDTSNYRDRQSEGTSSSFLTSKASSTYHIKYAASIDLHVDFADFNILNTFVPQFTAMEMVSIRRVDWHLTETTLEELKGTARKRAAQNALQRARDYAEVFAGLGAEDAVGRVRAKEIKEEGKYEERTRTRVHVGKKMGGGMKFIQKNVELTYEPRDVVVNVDVEGKFVVED